MSLKCNNVMIEEMRDLVFSGSQKEKKRARERPKIRDPIREIQLCLFAHFLKIKFSKNKDESSIGAVNVCNRCIVQIELLKIVFMIDRSRLC